MLHTANRYDLKVISQLAIECFCYLSHAGESEENGLSQKELKFLHTLATADNPKRAFDQVAAFEGNVQIQASICQKLNVTTVFQAIALASSKRWFDSLSYYSEEVITPVPKLAGCDLISMRAEPFSET